MKNDLKNAADRLFGDMKWEQADKNAVFEKIKGEEPKMKKKMSMGLVFAMALVLLCGVGLAVGLNYTPQYDALKTARNAVMEKYGLTTDMLRLFAFEKQETIDGATVTTYKTDVSNFLNPEAMGVYTVTDTGKNVTVTWSHDGVDLENLKTKDLTSDVWGAAQLESLIEKNKIFTDWQTKNWDALCTLEGEELSALYDELDQLIAPIKITRPYKITAEDVSTVTEETPEPEKELVEGVDFDIPYQPAKGQLSEKEIIALAKEAMIAEYGLSSEEADAYEYEALIGNDDPTIVEVYLHGAYNMGYVSIDPNTGAISKVVLDSPVGGNG